MDRFRVEVIRQVEAAHREPNRVLRVYFEIMPDTRIGGEEIRKARRVWDPHIILQLIQL